MWKLCMYMQCVCIYIYIGMCYLCTIHIIAAYTSTNKENAGPSMSVSVYIYIIIYIYAYGYGICNNHVAYITRSSWDISIHLKDCYLYGIYIYTLCTCGKIIDIVYYQIWNYFLTKHKHYMMFMHQIKQWRPSLYLLKEKKTTTTDSLHIKHAGSCYFASCYIFEN